MTPPIPIEPELAVALAMYSAPGAYALLLGSGISKSAGIPTGWDVVLDLIKRVAALHDAAAAAASDFEPEAWYQQTYGAEPTYTALLEQVAATPTERRALLRQYFEPTPAEREEGRNKAPTSAHRAIAQLVAGGYVRVIITTNFDQLLETALRDAGVVPAVVSSLDAIDGMMPLHLEPATIVKVHGDYLDTRIRNTAAELATYAPKLESLLARVFDEYGVIVAGWSAQWDDALRAALERCTSRRFTMFWAHRGPLTSEAQRLVEQRHAQTITIESADKFFDSIAERVSTLTALGRPHPMSLAIAVATLKRYMPVPADRIRLSDMLADEADRVVRRTLGAIPADRVPRDWQEAADISLKLEAIGETMTAMMATAGYWAEPAHAQLLVGVIERLANGAWPAGSPVRSSYPIWSKLFLYPAQRAFYASGIGALARGADGEPVLADLLLSARIRSGSDLELVPPVESLHVYAAMENDGAKHLPGKADHRTPLSDHLHETLREALRPIIPDDRAYADLFDRFEYFVSLTYGARRLQSRSGFWAPIGRYAWRRQRTEGERAMKSILEDIAAAGSNWFLLKRGLPGASPDDIIRVQRALNEQIGQSGWY